MKAFFKDVFRRMAVLFVSAALFAILSIIIFSFFAGSLLSPSQERIKKDSFLVLDLTMNLTDRPANVSFEELTRQALADEKLVPSYHIREVIDGLNAAAKDKNLKGIFMTGGFVPSGYGCGYETIQELIRALKSFKQSGKRIVGYLHSPQQIDYQVFSLCDELIMNPAGTMMLQGLASEQLFLGDTLEKYGVGVQVVRTGRYKGAVEPFTNNQFSPDNRSQVQHLLDHRWEHYLRGIAISRGMKWEDLNDTLAQKYLWKPMEAVEQGLVDRVDDFGGVIDRLIELGKEDDDTNSFTQIEFGDYLERLRPNPLELDEKDQKIALIYVEGAIVDGWGDDGQNVGGDEIARRIRGIRKKNDEYKAIVLRVNSPGGSVSGSEAILFELLRARECGIPVVVSMGPVAASGGYWIATASDKIFAGSQTITGSIGVFGILPNIKTLGANYGLNWDTVKTNPSSDIFSVARPKSVGEIKVIQNYVNQTYDRFLMLVGDSRNLAKKEVQEIAEGRVWLGKDALELGLVDEIGGLPQALEEAISLSNISGDFEIEEFPKVETPADAIAELLEVSSEIPRSFSIENENPLVKKLIEAKHLQDSLNDPLCLYGILPWYRAQLGFTTWKFNL
jgi:protease-4